MAREIKIAGIDVLSEIRHHDLGGESFLKPEDLDKLQAGSGILPYENLFNYLVMHAARFPEPVHEEIFQRFSGIWRELNRLPAEDKIALGASHFHERLLRANRDSCIGFTADFMEAQKLIQRLANPVLDLRKQAKIRLQAEADALLDKTAIGREYRRAIAAAAQQNRGGPH